MRHKNDSCLSRIGITRSPRPNDSFVQFTKDEIEQSIPSRFEQQVAKHPQKLAVKTKTHRFSYAELNELSNLIAGLILSERGDKEEPVALLLEQGAPLIAAILGVLKAGKIYVPMDPSQPKIRINSTLEDVQAGLIVTDDRNLFLSCELAKNRRTVLNVEEIDPDPSAVNPGLSLSTDTLAYIFYTSGSTGRPKGVVDNHRNVLHNIMRYTNSLHICSNDRLTLLQSCSFSGSVSSLFCSILNGATVFPYNIGEEGMGTNLARWLNREGITIYHSVPMIFRSFLIGDLEFPTVRLIRLEGDRASKLDVELFKRYFSSECILVNGLGATETGISRQYFIDRNTEISSSILPIGYPVEDMEIVLLDDNCKEIGENSIGEIAVRSSYLSLGYWRNPELTQISFLSDPSGGSRRIYKTGDMGRMRPDGCIEYLGRKDFHLKVRGFKVEPAEVEMALLEISGIEEAVVSIREAVHGQPQLVAYLVPSGNFIWTVGNLRQALAEKLPDYMIPSIFVKLQSLPVSANGKVDRQALPAPDQMRLKPSSTFIAPLDTVEKELVEIWEELLNIKPIGVRDNFFELGGDSLSAALMLARIHNTIGKDFPLATVYQAPTVELLAEMLRREEDALPESVLVPMQPSGSKPPFFCLHGHLGTVFHFANLVRRLGSDQPFYALQSIGISKKQIPLTRIEDMAARYILAIQDVQPEGPYFLGGYCFGGIVALEMAQQLCSQGQRVAFLALIDIGLPEFSKLVGRSVVKANKKTKSFMQKLRRKYVHLLGLEQQERIVHLKELTINKIKKNREKLKWKIGHKVYEGIGRPLPPTFWSVEQANDYSFISYVPRTYPGQVNLFLSTARVETDFSDCTLMWDKLSTEEVVVHEVPGERWWKKDMLSEPHVQILAEKLGNSLRDSQARIGENPTVEGYLL